MVRRVDLYEYIERVFDFLLAVDEEERVRHTSRLLQRAVGLQHTQLEGRKLSEVLTFGSLESVRSGIALARQGIWGMVNFGLNVPGSCPVPLKTTAILTAEGPIYLLVGGQLEGLAHRSEDAKDARIKELSCLYATAEWIEASRNVREFLTRLPEFLVRGMQYPETATVWVTFQGQEFGQKPPGKYISTTMVLRREAVGEIRVGYLDEDQILLPEEQRMLTEIGRMLNQTLDRKELAELLSDKQEELNLQRKRLEEMEAEIGVRAREIEEQHQKLSALNAYLERANRDWDASRRHLETLVQTIPDKVALIDRSRNLVFTNRAGVQREEKCHKAFFDRDIPCKDCRLARIIREKAPITLTIQHNGRYLEAHAMPLYNAEHEVDGIMEFYRDVTLERTYEEQVRQADKLASLGQLVSGIGHEINNPNQFIRGNIKILKQALEDMLPIVDLWHQDHPDLKIARLNYDFFRKHVMTLVDDMAHGSERIKGIVEGLRRFARKDEGLLIDAVDINTLVQSVSRLVHNEVHKTADLGLDLAPGLPTFSGNAQKIEQVLVNLVVNAAQAMPEDRRGNITVRTRSDGPFVLVDVEDDGKGMNEKTLSQIFDPFFTTKRARGGTGLGLPIAHRIVEEHGGTITVSSVVGQGTTFTVRLPLERPLPGERRTP